MNALPATPTTTTPTQTVAAPRTAPPGEIPAEGETTPGTLTPPAPALPPPASVFAAPALDRPGGIAGGITSGLNTPASYGGLTPRTALPAPATAPATGPGGPQAAALMPPPVLGQPAQPLPSPIQQMAQPYLPRNTQLALIPANSGLFG